MPDLVDLPGYIDENDHRGFLRAYLQLLLEGYSLAIPTQMTLAEIKESWTQILPRIHRNFTDNFVDHLGKFWIYLVKKQGGTVTETFVQDLLDIIDKDFSDAGEASEIVMPSREGIVDEVPDEATVVLNRDPLEDNVTPSISPNYYSFDST